MIFKKTTGSSQNVMGVETQNSQCVSINGLPDKRCTPGAVDPNVTQANIYSIICKSGYTKTVRPPVSYTNNLKVEQIAEYGYKDTSLKDYEEDHLIPLEVGGSPDLPENLWPEAYNLTLSSYSKDEVENYLNDQVCSGKMPLTEAQNEIANNWVQVYENVPNIDSFIYKVFGE